MSVAELTETLDEPTVRFMNIERAASLWLDEKRRQGLSASTLREYSRTLYDLHNLNANVDVSEVTATMLRRFLDAKATSSRPWEKGRTKSAMTRKNEIVAVDTFFDWLTGEGIIQKNPTRRNGVRILTRPKIGRPEDNPNVVRVSTPAAVKLLQAADGWQEKLTIMTLVYMGVRRHALALARLDDYDEDTGTLTFREKGRKEITKPVPAPLADLIEAAQAAGVYAEQPYLIPNTHRRPDESKERSDRIVWDIVKRVAERAGVEAHVHSLRAAFAVKFLEDRVGDQYDLQLLLGHASPSTTQTYVRFLDKRQRMETVRALDWGANVAAAEANVSPHFAGKRLASSSSETASASRMGERGFEPLSAEDGAAMPPRCLPAGDAPLADALLERVQADSKELA